MVSQPSCANTLSIALICDGEVSVKWQMQRPVILSEGIRAERRCSGTCIVLPFARFVLFCFSFLFFEAVQVYKNTAGISYRSWLCLHCKAEGITGDRQSVPTWACCCHEEVRSAMEAHQHFFLFFSVPFSFSLVLCRFTKMGTKDKSLAGFGRLKAGC